ncbi:MAG: hypothetical protein JWM73_27 [Solirubrobacterales bacterium]|nr:hypothetical protein [Solirubrobacterales bacterium]
MPRRTLLIATTALCIAAPATAATPPPADTPQQAVDAVKTVLKRTMKACHTDWARIDAVGYAGSWKVTVKVRASDAGEGTARWFIGKGWPAAKNALAKSLAAGCD